MKPEHVVAVRQNTAASCGWFAAANDANDPHSGITDKTAMKSFYLQSSSKRGSLQGGNDESQGGSPVPRLLCLALMTAQQGP